MKKDDEFFTYKRILGGSFKLSLKNPILYRKFYTTEHKLQHPNATRVKNCVRAKMSFCK